MFVCAFAYMCVYMCVCTCVCVHAYVGVLVYMYVHVCILMKLMEAFPDIITYEQRQLKEQECLRCQADSEYIVHFRYQEACTISCVPTKSRQYPSPFFFKPI